jgi:hypothetical protein
MVEHLATYLNKNGYPIIRRCFNCKHWKGDIQLGGEKPMGYCKVEAMYFAFTLQPTVYPITKDFYLCEKHEFENEEKLKDSSVMVSLKDSLKKKSDIL